MQRPRGANSLHVGRRLELLNAVPGRVIGRGCPRLRLPGDENRTLPLAELRLGGLVDEAEGRWTPGDPCLLVGTHPLPWED